MSYLNYGNNSNNFSSEHLALRSEILSARSRAAEWSASSCVPGSMVVHVTMGSIDEPGSQSDNVKPSVYSFLVTFNQEEGSWSWRIQGNN